MPDQPELQLDNAAKFEAEGKFQEADDAYKQLLKSQPNNADAWVLRAALSKNLSTMASAKEHLDQALTIDAKHTEANYIYAQILQAEGNSYQAKSHCQQAIDSDSKNVGAWTLLAAIHGASQSYDDALQCAQHAIDINPNIAEAWINRGNVFLTQKNYSAAINNFEQAIKANPESKNLYIIIVDILANTGNLPAAQSYLKKALLLWGNDSHLNIQMGHTLGAQGQFEQALSSYKIAQKYDPGATAPLIHQASTFMATVQYEKAIELYQNILKLDPEAAEAYCGLGDAQRNLGMIPMAVKNGQRAIELDPTSAHYLLTLSTSFLALGYPDNALAAAKKALTLEPNSVRPRAIIAEILERRGKLEEAYECILPSISGPTPNPQALLIFAPIAKQLGKSQQAIDLIEQCLLSTNGVSESQKGGMYFGLGHLYDKVGAYADAFKNFNDGNIAASYHFDREEYSTQLSSLKSTFSKSAMAALSRSTHDSTRPIFVVGMPRSGTTLIEQIIAAHPAAAGAGELELIPELASNFSAITGASPYPECLDAITPEQLDKLASVYLDRLDTIDATATRIADKMPANYLHVGLISLLFPNAKIIHALRDPRDTCLSCFFQSFSGNQDFSYNLSDLGFVYRHHSSMMAHWKQVLNIEIEEFQYDEMVSDPENSARKLIEYCGLDWDEQCLHFYKNKGFIHTSSYQQVRKPIYTSSLQRWKNYESFLDPLMKELEKT